MIFTRAWLIDALERVVRAFLIAFCSTLLLSVADVFSLSALHAAALAGVAACLSVVLSVLGASVPNGVSPASLVQRRHRGDAGLTVIEALVVALIVVVILAIVWGGFR